MPRRKRRPPTEAEVALIQAIAKQSLARLEQALAIVEAQEAYFRRQAGRLFDVKKRIV